MNCVERSSPKVFCGGSEAEKCVNAVWVQQRPSLNYLFYFKISIYLETNFSTSSLHVFDNFHSHRMQILNVLLLGVTRDDLLFIQSENLLIPAVHSFEFYQYLHYQ